MINKKINDNTDTEFDINEINIPFFILSILFSKLNVVIKTIIILTNTWFKINIIPPGKYFTKDIF